MDDRLHQLHAELEGSYWWFVAKNRILASLIGRYARRASTDGYGARPRLLDIGCGAGGLMRLLAPRFEVVGIDSSPLARAAAMRDHLTVVDGALPDRLPFLARRDRFDVIVMSEVLEHVRADRASVKAAADLLAPDGLLVCTVPAHPWLWSDHDVLNHHIRRYTRDTFAGLFAGLPLERLALSPVNAALFPAIAAARLTRRFLRPSGAAEPRTDLRPLPRPINALLTSIYASERHWLPHTSLPFGASLISVHRRRPDPSNRGESRPVPGHDPLRTASDQRGRDGRPQGLPAALTPLSIPAPERA